MLEMFGASFGATLAGCLTLIATTGAAVYFFVSRRKAFRQMQTIISEELSNVRELVTVRKNFTSTISLTEDKKIPYFNVRMPGSHRKFLMTYSGTITCGCDLDGIQYARAGNRVKIFVPRSEILDAYADVNSFNIHLQDSGLLAKNIQLGEQNKLLAEDLATQKQCALQEGITAQADDNVRQILTTIISRRGLNQAFDVEILFARAGEIESLNAP